VVPAVTIGTNDLVNPLFHRLTLQGFEFAGGPGEDEPRARTDRRRQQGKRDGRLTGAIEQGILKPHVPRYDVQRSGSREILIE
jgi:hypothetical protein